MQATLEMTVAKARKLALACRCGEWQQTNGTRWAALIVPAELHNLPADIRGPILRQALTWCTPFHADDLRVRLERDGWGIETAEEIGYRLICR